MKNYSKAYIKKIGIGSIVIIVIILSLLYFFNTSQRSTSHKKILELDLSLQSSLKILNFLLTEDNLYGRLYAREKLFLASYEDLKKILLFTQKKSSLAGVSAEIKNIIDVRENAQQFLLEEDILLNYAPLSYNERKSDEVLNIKHLRKDREYLYPKELILNYSPSNLVKVGKDYLFNPKKVVVNSRENISRTHSASNPRRYSIQKSNQPFFEGWRFFVPEDFLSIWFFWDLRQWVKRYEESSLFPIVNGDVVYLRNENRLFCLSKYDGYELWSLDFDNNQGEQYYQTYRHPHQNSFGYEMLVEKARIYTEIRGSFIAINVEDIKSPRILWESSLGQYTVCISPVHVENLIIVGLINAKGELWVVGFNDETGIKKWERYIGLSSFLSPASTLTFVCGRKIYIGSNHGVIICLDALDGSVYWLRKYVPKKYSLFDYWFKEFYNGIFTDQGQLAYDRQFMTINKGFLFLKPRESDFIYFIEAETGELQDSLLVDRQRDTVLSIDDESGIFIGKMNGRWLKDYLLIVKSQTGDLLENFLLADGELKGVFRRNEKFISFKKGDHIYGLDICNRILYDYGDNFPKQGWLVFSDGNVFMIADKQELIFFRNSSKQEKMISSVRRESMALERLQNAIKNARERPEILKELTNYFQDPFFKVQEIVPFVVKNSKQLVSLDWQNFFEKINSIHSNHVITYNNVQMKFGCFLYEKGLIRFALPQKNIPKKDEVGKENVEKLSIVCEQIDMVVPEIISGPKSLNFTLLLSYDQLICINEDGNIRWVSKIFYHPVEDYQTKKKNYKNVGRIYTGNITAYIIDNILITNDQVNVVARNINSGVYQWSMTNSGNDFMEQKKLPVNDMSQLYRKYKVNREFIDKCNIHSYWQGERFFLIHKNVLYQLNPIDGFVKSKIDLPIDNAMSITSDGVMTYAIPAGAGKILSIDTRSYSRQVSKLDFINNPDAYYQIRSAKNYIVIWSDEVLYILKKNDFSLVQRIDLSGFSKPICVVEDNQLILIDVFKMAQCYVFTKSGIFLVWENCFGKDGFDSSVMEKYDYKNQFFYMVNNYLLLSTMKDGFLKMVALQIEDGKLIHEWAFSDLRGSFYSLSNLRQKGNKIYFIASTAVPGDPAGDLHPTKTMTLIFSKLIEIDLATGGSSYLRTLPPVGGLMDSNLKNSILTETQHLYITLSKGFFSMERK